VRNLSKVFTQQRPERQSNARMPIRDASPTPYHLRHHATHVLVYLILIRPSVSSAGGVEVRQGLVGYVQDSVHW